MIRDKIKTLELLGNRAPHFSAITVEFRRLLVALIYSVILSIIGILPAFSDTLMPLQHGIALSDAKWSTLPIESYYVSEKLDGVRGYWTGKEMLSRQGYPITMPKWFTQNLGDKPLDGEIWLGRETFETLSGLIAREDVTDPLWQSVTYQIFDMPAEKGTFKERVLLMKAHIASLQPQNPHLKMIPQEKFSSKEALETHLQAIAKAGGEGLMLHHQDAYYQPYNRTNALIKLKVIDEGCALVRGYSPGKGKYQGMVGSLRVETMIDGEKRYFKVGSGLTDLMRKDPPEIGQAIIYRHNDFTKNGIPRFPRFKTVHVEENCDGYWAKEGIDGLMTENS